MGERPTSAGNPPVGCHWSRRYTMIFQSRYGQGYGKGRLLCWSPALTSSRRDRRSRVRRPWNHKGINSPLYGEAQRAGLASSNSSNHSPEMWVYRILILIVYYTHDFTHTTDMRADHRSAGVLGSEAEGAQGRSVERTKTRLWAQLKCYP